MTDPVKEFERYRRELLEGLGDRDPLHVLAATPGRVGELLADVGERASAGRPREDAWSVREIVGHLTDTEWVYGYRMRVMLTHESPTIPGYDQDLAVSGLAHNERMLATLISEFATLRQLNVDLYRRTEGAAWERVGLHAERGPESVGLSVRLLAGHDLRHLDQMERTLAEVGTRG